MSVPEGAEVERHRRVGTQPIFGTAQVWQWQRIDRDDPFLGDAQRLSRGDHHGQFRCRSEHREDLWCHGKKMLCVVDDHEEWTVGYRFSDALDDPRGSPFSCAAGASDGRQHGIHRGERLQPNPDNGPRLLGLVPQGQSDGESRLANPTGPEQGDQPVTRGEGSFNCEKICLAPEDRQRFGREGVGTGDPRNRRAGQALVADGGKPFLTSGTREIERVGDEGGRTSLGGGSNAPLEITDRSCGDAGTDRKFLLGQACIEPESAQEVPDRVSGWLRRCGLGAAAVDRHGKTVPQPRCVTLAIADA